MLTNLLEKSRKLNQILQDRGDEKVSFNELCDTIADILEVNVYAINAKGKILGSKMVDTNTSSILADPESGEMFFSAEHNENMLKITETIPNMTADQVTDTFKGDTESYHKHISIVPIKSKGQRIGTFVLARVGEEFDDADMILAENAATVISMEITRARKLQKEALDRKKSIVKMAIESLSFSELEAIEHIFNELEGDEGLLVASKVADRVGITRSVIVNALRKFESAGVIESRSLGMKGTHIRILNEELIPELEAIKKKF